MKILLILFFLIVFVMVLIPEIIMRKKFSEKENGKKKVIKSKIGLLPSGLVEIKGKLRVINTTISPISKSKCIGYHYSELQYTSSQIRTLEDEREVSRWKNWKEINSKSECNDFYIEDESGKIKVIAKNILIAININKTEKNNTNHLKNIEYLLLEDDAEYVLVGKVILNKKGEKVIKKNKHQFFISDTLYYNLTNDKTISNIKKVGILIFIIILLLIYYSFFITN